MWVSTAEGQKREPIETRSIRLAILCPLKQYRPRSQPRPVTQDTTTGRVKKRYLVAKLSKLGLGLAVDLSALLSLGKVAASGLLALVVGVALDLAALLKTGNNVLVFPANLVGQTTDR